MINFKPNTPNKLIWTLLLVVVLIALLLFTNPNKVALPILIAPFLLIGFIIFGAIGVILSRRNSSSKTYAARLFPVSIAFLVVALLLLRSLHQLTLKDSLLVCGFTAAFWLYVWRADFLHK